MDSKEIYDFLIKVQSIAKIGLVYSKDPYAISNYQEINDLTLRFLEDFENIKLNRNNYFKRDVYPTPNISVRTIILNNDKTKVLMVREKKDESFSLPGGWCDLYDSPSEAAKKECLQEAGANVEIIRLVGILNRTPFKQKTSVPEYVIVFLAKLNGELVEHEYETDGIFFFDIDNLPTYCDKVSLPEIKKMLHAAINNETIFD